MLFNDRRDAGRRLAERLEALACRDPVVMALPRGGVPLGFEIAGALHAPLELVQVRKLGAPGQEELAIGAVADGAAPELVTDAALIRHLGVPAAYLTHAIDAAEAEMARRRRVYGTGGGPRPLEGRTAILVDDGIATGATMLCAIRATRRRAPARLILAVPVAPHDTLHRLRAEVDDIVCLHTPENFGSVGRFYRQFPQVSDAEVTELLARAWRGDGAGPGTPGDSRPPS